MGLLERFKDNTERSYAPVGMVINRTADKSGYALANTSTVPTMRVVFYGGDYLVVADRSATRFSISGRTLENARPASPKAALQPGSSFERALSEVERLKDNWAGPGSVAPPNKVVADLRFFLSLLEPKTRAPETEVDIDDGSVTLRWYSQGSTFSCIFSGDGAVIGVFSSLTEPRPASWRCSLADERALQKSLDDAQVRAFMGT